MSAPDRTGYHDVKNTEQHIQNKSYDQEFEVTAIEMLGHDPASSVLRRISTSQRGSKAPMSVEILDASGNQITSFGGGAALSDYMTNDVDEATSTLTYVGKEDGDGNWAIQKIDESSGTSITYATVTNNSGTTSYSTAWTNRASLTYNDYSVAFT